MHLKKYYLGDDKAEVYKEVGVNYNFFTISNLKKMLLKNVYSPIRTNINVCTLIIQRGKYCSVGASTYAIEATK